MRPALLAAVLLLTLLVQGAARPARLGELTAVTNTGDAGFTLLTADAIYLAREDGRVSAIPLVPGGPSWSVRVDGVSPLTLSLADGTLVVRPTTSFLDARTGRERWRTQGPSYVRVLGDRVAYADLSGTLRMADVATGRVLWQRATSAWTFDGDVENRYVIGIDGEGRAVVYSAVDGSVISGEKDLAVDTSGPDTVGVAPTEIIGDTIYMYGQTSLAAYRLRDLAPLWRIPITPDQVGPCGNLICVTAERGAWGLDPATGAVRWHSPRWRVIDPDGLAVARDQRVARIDPATGRVVRELGHGSLAGDLLLRYDRDHTFVTRSADGRVLGGLPVFAPSGCNAAGRFLACPASGRSLTVWRIS
ncbi:PQQ-binding-like beta-propeller repeat protein [Actinoplanes sp. KI2]|uniref:outer membrane protein assembly factor BamB family protein n=1 Tax=Actinoplanes sp. KI2 TaxID=2983315 RepID=UPI0021D5CF98|nr:PQQ-binding-like beta-propeller repeat protein [Actinoplanes sp. KI2]MCU7725743.1 PQQ-binding-like beta-propeller repeat protein [Actinoplanes sp. KI2]